jgi:hypothetical protein
MKLISCFLFGAMLSTSLLAQQVTNAPPAAPIETPAAAVTNAPSAAESKPKASTNATATKAAKKKAITKKKAPAPAPVKKQAAELRTTPLVPGPAVVVANNVNVRGRPS